MTDTLYRMCLEAVGKQCRNSDIIFNLKLKRQFKNDIFEIWREKFYSKVIRSRQIECPHCNDCDLASFPAWRCKNFYCVNRHCKMYKKLVLTQRKYELFLPNLYERQKTVCEKYFCKNCDNFSYQSGRMHTYCDAFDDEEDCVFPKWNPRLKKYV